MLALDRAFAHFPILETERLILREFRAEDAGAIFAIMSDPEVMRYFGQAPMQAPERAEQRVVGITADFAEQKGIRWAITRRSDGQFIGSAGFWRIMVEHQRAEIGYELARAAWGEGIMPEALRAILAFGFATLGLHSVEAQIDPENRASRRVLEKLGFRQEGLLRESFYEPERNLFTDNAIFGLLAREWGK